MTKVRHSIAIVCFIVSFTANAGEELTTEAKSIVNQPTNAELQLLQGTWEGVMVGQEKDGKITITITGNALHFHRDTKFWFETAITLPAGKDPKQLHATIKHSAPPEDANGKVVRAFFKIEDGTLTLATIGDDAEETQKGFEAAPNRYELRKVQAETKNTELPKSK